MKNINLDEFWKKGVDSEDEQDSIENQLQGFSETYEIKQELKEIIKELEELDEKYQKEKSNLRNKLKDLMYKIPEFSEKLIIE